MRILITRNSNERIKCVNCEDFLKWENISWITTFPETAVCKCDCTVRTANERIQEIVKIWLSVRNDIEKLEDMVVNELGEEWKELGARPVKLTEELG